VSYPPPPPGSAYPPPSPKPRIDPKLVRPGRGWYALTPIPALVGLILTVVFVVQIVGLFVPNLDRLQAPGSLNVALDAGEGRGIYVQTFGAIGAFPRVTDSDLGCAVREDRNGSQVPLEPVQGANFLTIGTATYVERQRFEAPRDGRYAVECSRRLSAPLALGPTLSAGGLVIPILGVSLSLLVGLALSAVIAITITVLRARHRKRLRAEATSGTTG